MRTFGFMLHTSLECGNLCGAGPSAHTQATSLAAETVFRICSCCHFGYRAVPNAELLRKVCDGLHLCPGKQSINNGSSDAPKPMWVLLLLTDLSVPEIGTLSGEEGSRSLISDTLSLSSSCSCDLF